MTNYYKIKAAYLECALKIAQATAMRDAVAIAEGLDPSQSLSFDDAHMTITTVPAGPREVLPMPPIEEAG